MTVVKLTYIYCDGGEPCDISVEGEPFTNCPDPGATAAYERATAALHGWRHIKGKDYCPDCAERLFPKKQGASK